MFLFSILNKNLVQLLKCNKNYFKINVSNCRKSTKSNEKMKYLNVAEKNDAAKSIASILSKGTARRTEGLSKFNKLYVFDANFRGAQTTMVMTSVSGHLLTFDFLDIYKHWQGCDPISLFDAPVTKHCPDNFKNIKKTLEREVNQGE